MLRRFFIVVLTGVVAACGFGCGKETVDEQAQMNELQQRANEGRPLSTKERELLMEEAQEQQAQQGVQQ
jgi:hypothetical protein